MKVTSVYARKAVYGGIHVLSSSTNFYPVGSKFAMYLHDGKIIFTVKKVEVDADDNNKLNYQLVDNGESPIFYNGCDIRPLMNETLEEYIEPETIEYNDDDASEDNGEQ